MATAARASACARIEDIESPVGVAHAYDMTHILAKAIDLAGTTERAAVRDALEKVRAHDGLVRRYAPPFTPTRHEALGADELLMARYRADGVLVPATQVSLLAPLRPASLARRFALAAAGLAAAALLLISLASWWLINSAARGGGAAARGDRAAVPRRSRRQRPERAGRAHGRDGRQHDPGHRAGRQRRPRNLPGAVPGRHPPDQRRAGRRCCSPTSKARRSPATARPASATNSCAGCAANWPPAAPPRRCSRRRTATADLVALAPMRYARTASPEGALFYKVSLGDLRLGEAMTLEWGAPAPGLAERRRRGDGAGAGGLRAAAASACAAGPRRRRRSPSVAPQYLAIALIAAILFGTVRAGRREAGAGC